jgi:hypothetical protein
MLVRKSNLAHPEFDLAAARRVFVEAGAHEDLSGELITSPHDLFSVETLRNVHGLRMGTTVPTDVFVFGKGESLRPDCTKVGGRPYWPADRPWPTNAEGAPFHFLAQFNFADSRDLFADLTGDVLLLLAEDVDNYLWEPDRIRLEWLPLGLHPASRFDFSESVGAVKAGPFYGVIFRSADYPDAVSTAYDLDVDQSYNLPILNGTKIGGIPHFIQGGDVSSGEFLCQLGSIQAAPDVPFPWVNQALPLGLTFDDRGIYGPENSMVFDDMGTIYIFRKKDGTVACSFECY